MPKYLLFVILVLIVSLTALAQDEPKAVVAHSELLTCIPHGLTPVTVTSEEGLILDLLKSAGDVTTNSVMRDYDIPNTEIRVSYVLRHLPDHVEISKTFFKKTSTGWALMLAFAAPTSLDLPLPSGTIFVLKSGESSGTIPSFELECQFRRIGN